MHTQKYIQKFLNNMYIQTPKVPSVPKKELIIILPYLGNMSQIVKTKLTKNLSKHMKFCKRRVIIQTNNRRKNYFRFKDFVPEALRSSLIYFRAEAAQPPTLVRPIDISK